MTSAGNVEVIRRLIGLFNARAFEVIEPLLHPNLVWYPEEDQPESGPFYGRDSYLRYAQEWTETFEGYNVEPLEVLEVGDCVAAVARFRGSGRRSGVNVDTVAAGVWRLRDGVVVEHRECSDREQAMRLAELPSFGEAAAP